MKKILLLAFSVLFSNFLLAQCTPSLAGPYSQIIPDTNSNLPRAHAGQMYSTDIQLYVPHDTIYLTVSVPVVDFTLNSVTGLPPHFSYHSNPASGVFPGASAGCVHIQSDTAPTYADVGTYTMTVSVTAHITLVATIPYPITFQGYKIIVDSGFTGIQIHDDTQFAVSQNFPNPAAGLTDISVISSRPGKVSVTVFDILGNQLMENKYGISKGMSVLSLPVNTIPRGIYIYKVNNGSETITRRMILSD